MINPYMNTLVSWLSVSMPALSDSPCVQLPGIPTVNVFIYGVASEIRTHGFWDLQSHALGRSAIATSGTS